MPPKRLALSSSNLPPTNQPPVVAFRMGLAITSTFEEQENCLYTEIATRKEKYQPRIKLPQVEYLNAWWQANMQYVPTGMVPLIRQTLEESIMPTFGLKPADVTITINPTVDVMPLPPSVQVAKKADEIHIFWVHLKLLQSVPGLRRSNLHSWVAIPRFVPQAHTYRQKVYNKVLRRFNLLASGMVVPFARQP